MNEYVSVTVWKYSDPIDWADMQAMLPENMEDQDAQKGQQLDGLKLMKTHTVQY